MSKREKREIYIEKIEKEERESASEEKDRKRERKWMRILLRWRGDDLLYKVRHWRNSVRGFQNSAPKKGIDREPRVT